MCVSQSGTTVQRLFPAYTSAGASRRTSGGGKSGCSWVSGAAPQIPRPRNGRRSAVQQQQRGEAFLRWALGGLGRRGWAVPSTPAPARRPPRTHRLLQGASETSRYLGEDGTLGIGERGNVRQRGIDTMQVGDISGSVMAWTKCCYLHTR